MTNIDAKIIQITVIEYLNGGHFVTSKNVTKIVTVITYFFQKWSKTATKMTVQMTVHLHLYPSFPTKMV